MDRREYLLGVTSATGLLAGCNELSELNDAGADDDDTEEADDETPAAESVQVQAVREFFRALDEGDISTVNELTHPESPFGELSADSAERYRDEVSLTVESASLSEVDGDRATVDVTMVIEEATDSEPQRQTRAIKLRETVDGWRFYDSNPREETTPTETTPNDEGAPGRIQVTDAVGRDIQNGKVRTVQFSLEEYGGSGNIDLSQLRIEWVDSSGVYMLTYGERPDEQTFTVDTIQDDNESLSGTAPVIDDSSDRALIQVSVPTFREDGLKAGEVASVEFVTESDRETHWELQVPDSLSGVETVEL
ncbi:hypothetical protein [Salinibaculum rarum]|uniref:hypothetical protein n=1 Tax=Salinibaculum rarum TaxID=3058903 RepID=UPI0026601C04|nr:hypothetical protein [Salinibaculum sp. KK48]